MTAVIAPDPRHRQGRGPDHSGIRLPQLPRRFVPNAPAHAAAARRPSRRGIGGPPLRLA